MKYKKFALIYEQSPPSCLFDPTHVENPRRFQCVLDRCREYGLVERCVDIRPVSATDAQLDTAHTKELVQYLKSVEGVTDPEELKEHSKKYVP